MSIEAIKKALEAEPTSSFYTHPRDDNKWKENEALALACDPDTLRELIKRLEQQDQLIAEAVAVERKKSSDELKDLKRANKQWGSLVWRLAPELNCLPSVFADGNDHLLKSAIKLNQRMKDAEEREAIRARASAPKTAEHAPYYSAGELAQGFVRYEKARLIKPLEWAALWTRALAGERFDDLVDALPAPSSCLVLRNVIAEDTKP